MKLKSISKYGTSSLALMIVFSAYGCVADQKAASVEHTSNSYQHSTQIDLAEKFAKPGFVLFEDDGRLWVFKENSPELADFVADGDLAKHVVRPGAGPDNITLRSPDNDVLLAYVASRPGFHTYVDDGRIWVFLEGDEEHEKFVADGEIAKHVVRPGAGPLGTTLRAPDSETIIAYVTAKPGYVTIEDNGRVWVFEEGCDELQEFLDKGDLAKHIVRPGAGPMGLTLRSPESETIDAYLSASSY